MSKQNTPSPITTIALPTTQAESSDGSLLIKKYLFHWPLFILAVILTTVGGYFYLKIAKPVYPIVATLEFKAPTASSASLTVNQNSTEQQLDPIDKPVIVENEIEVMQSKKLIYQVVNELQLWTNYYQKKGLSTKDLYKQAPVVFKFIQQDGNIRPAGEKLQILIKDNNSFEYKDEHGQLTVAKLSAPIKTSFGTWQLDATPKFNSFIDSTITIIIQDPDLVADVYQNGIKVALENKDAPFVNLTTSDVVPQRGKDVLNSLMALYLQYAIEDKNKLSQRTLKFVDFRLDSLKKELNTIEKQVEDYKSSQGMTDISAQAQSYRDLNVVNFKDINDVDVQLGVLNTLEKYANSSQIDGKLPVSTGSVVDPSLSSLYDRLSELQVKRNELLATMPEKNPMVVSINEQIRTLRADFSEKIHATKASLLAQKTQLTSFGKGVQGSLKMVPGQTREIGALQRLQISKENIYKFLLEKREQVALRYASSVSDSEVVDDAHAGKVKWPIPAVIYGLSLLLGLAAAAGILYLRESLNDLITSRRQIEDETNVSILGELSYQDIDQQIVVSEGRSKFAIGEQFRVLRTNLYHLHNNNDSGRVTLFTSSVSGEGKSFVSSNLAVTLAYASRKTIILEMDLRKPKVSVNFGLDPERAGISNFLAEEVTDVKSLIQHSGIPNLDVLSCGAILPNPSELLEKNKLDELINILKEWYDDVIIDSPPIHLVTDALIIARVADAALYVVRQGYTHKYELEFINEIDEANRFPKFTIVFNGVKKGASGYGYGYGYGGYGYGNNNYYNSYATTAKRGFGDKLKSIFSRF
jgi:tyrosine-protein kinase Etk/Wzc